MQFIGNTKIVKNLQGALEKGRLNHAYLFTGPEHLGKFTLAKLWAQAVVKGESLKLEIQDIDRVAVLDIVVVEPEIVVKNNVAKQRDISIETIREAQQKLSLFPYGGKYKVLIINDAHRLNNASQNALLKILEEPNLTTIIILVTSEVDRILPTIQSRCQEVKFGLVAENQLLEMTNEAQLVSLSMGRPGLVSKFSNDKNELEIYKEGLAQLELVMRGTLNEKFKLAEELSKNIFLTSAKLNNWLWFLHKKTELAGEFERLRLYGAIEKIQASLAVLKRTNANSRLMLETLFMDL